MSKCPTCGHEGPKPRPESPFKERNAEIVRLIDEENLKHVDIARRYNITPPRVRQIYMSAVRKRTREKANHGLPGVRL